MLESYDQEIQRKRRASRIFWFLVFSFATFLYFFFKGYYPALDITWKQIFSSGGVKELTRDELIRSFGIINIRAYPRDATITINGDDFGFDEKKMVPYGKYRLSVGKPGYIQDRMRFEINKFTPFFISEVHLMPRASYTEIGTGMLDYMQTNTNEWVASDGKKLMVYDRFFMTGSRLQRNLKPIGEGYFQSGTSLYRLSNGEWERKSWSGSTKFLSECPNPKVIEEYLSCMENQSALSSAGLMLTGVTKISPGYILQNGILLDGKKAYTLHLEEQTSSLFIRHNDTWYTANGGFLVPLIAQREKTSVPLIFTGLETIREVRKFEDEIIVFGTKGKDTFMSFIKDDDIQTIPFPDISLENLEIRKYLGTYFIKTDAALLFLYEGSERIEWLTEGKILAFSNIAAIYEKEGKIWRVSWLERE